MKDRLTRVFPIFLLFGFQLISTFANAAEPSGVWKGAYTCSDGQWNATIIFKDENTAVHEYAPGKDAPASPGGSYSMDIWRKGDDLLLTPIEWIQEVRNHVMLSMRLSPDGDSLKGPVGYKGCGDITVEPYDASQTATVGTSSKFLADTTFPLHFTSVYECPRRSAGSYWKIDKSESGNLIAELSIREFINPTASNQYTINLTQDENLFSGMVSNGSWGISVEYDSPEKPPTALWLDRKGNPNTGNCSNPVLKPASGPVAAWEDFFQQANDAGADIGLVKTAANNYKTLPSEKYLPALDQESYKTNRNTAWQTLQENYANSASQLINDLSVDTPQQRQEARKLIAAMSSPGFKHKISFRNLYANVLIKNDIPREPIYFSDDENELACERVEKNSNIGRQLVNLEWFVGLPAVEWTREITENVVSKIEGCANNNADLQTNAASLLKIIAQHVPSLEQAEANLTWLKEQTDSALAQPRNLNTLMATQNYQLQSQEIRKYKIDNNTYSQYFYYKLTDTRSEALANAKEELNEMHSNSGKSINEDYELYNSCVNKLGNPRRQLDDWLQALYSVCSENANTAITSHFEELNSQLSPEIENTDEFLLYINSEANVTIDRFAGAVGRRDEYREYSQKLRQSQADSVVAFTNKLSERATQNEVGAKEDIEKACGNIGLRVVYQQLGDACSTLTKAIREKETIAKNAEKQSQCNELVSSMNLPSDYSSATLLYGDTLDSKEIQLSSFICELNEKGIDVRISKKGAVKAVENTYGRPLFESDMVTIGEKDGNQYWGLENIDVAIDDPRLQGVSSGRFIQCLLKCEI